MKLEKFILHIGKVPAGNRGWMEEIVASLGNCELLNITDMQDTWAVERQKDMPATKVSTRTVNCSQKLGFYFGGTWDPGRILNRRVSDQIGVLSLKLSLQDIG